MAVNLISLLIVIPLLGALVVLFIPRRLDLAVKCVALATVVVNFAVSVFLFATFRADTAEMQFVERAAWIPQLGISWYVGVDGLSLLLVVLTTFLMIIAIGGSWNAITDRVKEYNILFLILESGVIGVFVSLDLFLFYVFWEFTLIPMAFLIGVWGHGRRVYAAIKFILFTMLGSTLMLVALLALVFIHRGATGTLSFALTDILKTPVPVGIQPVLFAAFALAFAIKVPMFPFHTWLPDAHVEAPTAGSVILAGVLLKMGTYGFVRFNMPLFPQAARDYAPLLIALAIIGIIYGAIVSAVQRDIKSLVAFSSVSHLGFVMLGLFAFNAQGISGGILQMINHGLSTGALFLLVGMLYERRHTRLIEDFGGIAKVMPIYAAFFLIVMFSSVGLPGLNGFVGEFLILVGAFQANVWYAVLAATGVVLSAIYLLWMYQRAMNGPITNDANKNLPDLSRREIALMVALVVFIVWIGVYPRTFLDPMQASVTNLLAVVAK
ncbi:MAG: NADH-quinone oxidoreductase subunit M [Chloroflexi bacterium]|nr:NADH-quinone oxidoreductase subunit M [Chloroflexota bacterium]